MSQINNLNCDLQYFLEYLQGLKKYHINHGALAEINDDVIGEHRHGGAEDVIQEVLDEFKKQFKNLEFDHEE